MGEIIALGGNMKNAIKLMAFILAAVLFITNPAFTAEKEVILQTTSTWDNAAYKKLKIKKPEVTVLKIIINVGESLPMHKHDLVNIAYVKKGTLTVITEDNKEITLHEGDALPELIGKYHYGKNTGNEPIELIVFYLGEKGTPLSVNK